MSQYNKDSCTFRKHAKTSFKSRRARGLNFNLRLNCHDWDLMGKHNIQRCQRGCLLLFWLSYLGFDWFGESK